MTITLDTGTFEVGNSLISIAEADEYYVSRGYTAWTELSDDAKKEAALVRAFDFLSVQNWRTDTFTAGIPAKIKQAQCIAALRELSSPGSMQPDRTTGLKMESVDGVFEKQFFEGGGSESHTAVNNLILPYLVRAGVKTRIVR